MNSYITTSICLFTPNITPVFRMYLVDLGIHYNHFNSNNLVQNRMKPVNDGNLIGKFRKGPPKPCMN